MIDRHADYAVWVWVNPDTGADLLPYAVEQLERKMIEDTGRDDRSRWEWSAAAMAESTMDGEPVIRPRFHPGEVIKVYQVNLVSRGS